MKTSQADLLLSRLAHDADANNHGEYLQTATQQNKMIFFALRHVTMRENSFSEGNQFFYGKNGAMTSILKEES